MATTSDLTLTPLSGYNHIDALLDQGPDWNFFSGSPNTLYYSFSVAAGLESAVHGQQAFSASQQTYVRGAFGYLAALTGIRFVETGDGAAAQVHFANLDLQQSPYTTGLSSWRASYTYDDKSGALYSYDADDYIYLDNAEWRAENANLAPGGDGYETLLHELGHMLGLKHPFESGTDNPAVLPAGLDSTAYTLMSYHHAGGPYPEFRQFDLAALMWLYGGDGLGGALGIGSATGARYLMGTNGADALTGTAAADVLEGDGGDDRLDGGAGVDTARYQGVHTSYAFSQSGGACFVTATAGGEGTDTLTNIEYVRCSDGTYSLAQLLSDASAGFAGTAGADRFVATAGNNLIDGLGGVDTVAYGGARGAYQVAHRPDGAFTVTDTAGNGGTDTLVNVERIHFGDADLAIDVGGHGGQAYRIYQAAFDRAPDSAGAGFWISRLDQGVSLEQIAGGFMASSEFVGKYGANPSSSEFVNTLYQNVLHRAGEPAGVDFWLHALDTGVATRAEVLAQFSESAENQAQVIGSIQDGFLYTPFTA